MDAFRSSITLSALACGCAIYCKSSELQVVSQAWVTLSLSNHSRYCCCISEIFIQNFILFIVVGFEHSTAVLEQASQQTKTNSMV
jgi:hypothetical protein